MRLNLVRIITADCAPSPGADIAGVRLTRCGEGRGEPSLGAGRNHRPRHRASAALSPHHSTTKTSGYGCRRPLRIALQVAPLRETISSESSHRAYVWAPSYMRMVSAESSSGEGSPLTATGACASHICIGTKWARPSHIFTLPSSAAGPVSVLPHLQCHMVRPEFVCIGTIPCPPVPHLYWGCGRPFAALLC